MTTQRDVYVCSARIGQPRGTWERPPIFFSCPEHKVGPGVACPQPAPATPIAAGPEAVGPSPEEMAVNEELSADVERALVAVVREDFPTGGAVENVVALVIEKALVRVRAVMRSHGTSAEVERLRAQRDAYKAMALGPNCDACDSEVATNVTPDGFHGCDEHRSPGSVDLSYAAALRTIAAES